MAQVKRLVIDVKKTFVFEDEHFNDNIIKGLQFAQKLQNKKLKRWLSLVFDRLSKDFSSAEEFIAGLDENYDYNLEDCDYKIRELFLE